MPPKSVMPAQAGIHEFLCTATSRDFTESKSLDARLRGHDGKE
jgi:hypothetical protein